MCAWYASEAQVETSPTNKIDETIQSIIEMTIDVVVNECLVVVGDHLAENNRMLPCSHFVVWACF